jgi:hypothetical protein
MFRNENWREEFVRNKRVDTNEDIAYKEITNCTNAIKLKNTRYELDNQVRGTQSPLEFTWE